MIFSNLEGSVYETLNSQLGENGEVFLMISFFYLNFASSVSGFRAGGLLVRESIRELSESDPPQKWIPMGSTLSSGNFSGFTLQGIIPRGIHFFIIVVMIASVQYLFNFLSLCLYI